MATMNEIYQYRIHQLSEQIRDLKAAARKMEKTEPHCGPVEKNGVTEYAMIDQKLVTISPAHPEWKKYRELKDQASLCLTALKILKNTPHGFVVGKTAPKKEDLRKALRQNREKFTCHCRGGKNEQNNLIFGAYSDLLKTEQDLRTNPTRFAEAEAYATKRREEVANAAH